jgi:predicted enzyme related to lactoylglutathione lyase
VSDRVHARAILVSVFCRDHVALAGFYRRAFGFGEIEVARSPIFTALDAGGITLGFHADEAYDLLGLADRRGVPPGATHVTIEVGSFEDVDAALGPLLAAGATLVQGPFTTYYDARQLVLLDPEGNVLRVSSSQAGVSDPPRTGS